MRLSLLIGGLIALGAASALAAESATATPAIDFNGQIRPILSNHCFQCHGPDVAQRKAGLRLDLRDEAFRATESGVVAIVPRKPAESELVRRIFAADDERMPPADSNKRLTEAEKSLLKEWVAAGAPWQDHWSFIAPVRPALPTVSHAGWSRNAIDDFILSRLDQERLAPSPQANRPTLIRRLSLDLTGLPPTPEEVDRFVNDAAGDAYEELVARLLASPRYGERMAQEWLDAARFADTHGYHIDAGRDMSRWRDWVIGSYNRNLPFDQFTIEQLAGDLLPNPTLDQLIASGFNRNHMINFEGGAVPEEYHTAYIVDRVNTTSTVWLGLTVACTQCHDHKYDPLTQREFYELYAFFHNVPENGLDGRKGNAEPMVKAPSREERQKLDELSRAIAELDRELDAPIAAVDAAQAAWEKDALEVGGTDGNILDQKTLSQDVHAALAVPSESRNEDQRSAVRKYFRRHVSNELKPRFDVLAGLRARQADLDKAIPTVMVMREMPQPRDTYLLVRGQYDKHGEKVLPGVPACLPPLADGAPANRLGLARWLVGPAHPLTARVVINRFWQMLFGTGLVKTAEDFGSQGERPSHSELLDWLAVEFRESGWDVKHMLRLMVSSATYRQSSVAAAEFMAKDPENRLLARMSRLRLPAEAIRDQALAAGGLLDGRIGGASVSPYQPPGLWEELMSREDGANWTAQTYVQSHGADLYRRTMYTFWKRTSPPPTLSTFDAPDREVCTVRRARTNTPLQALILLNDPTYVEAARKLAERVLREAGSTEDRMERMFQLVLARRPSGREAAVLRSIVEEQLAKFRVDHEAAVKLLSVGESPRDERFEPAELAAWSAAASVVLNLDEAVTRN
ncbi:MAG TPA: PSD1 and planctomycete cytochrome C domain-containing protein [Pirellulales bacterium]|nr:PSD1 and planctomycete cytochrome C domain-containing protein [Pirellulales bacterium]